MENLTHTAEHVLEDFHSADLSQSEKKKISREISTALAGYDLSGGGADL